MGQEIERKFTVTGDGWRTDEGVRFRQGYLNRHRERTVRVRTEGKCAVITVNANLVEHPYPSWDGRPQDKG